MQNFWFSLHLCIWQISFAIMYVKHVPKTQMCAWLTACSFICMNGTNLFLSWMKNWAGYIFIMWNFGFELSEPHAQPCKQTCVDAFCYINIAVNSHVFNGISYYSFLQPIKVLLSIILRIPGNIVYDCVFYVL